MNKLYKINDYNNNDTEQSLYTQAYTQYIKNAIFDYIKSYNCDSDDGDGECEFYE